MPATGRENEGRPGGRPQAAAAQGQRLVTDCISTTISRGIPVQSDRLHQKVTQASLLDKLDFLRRNPAIFMAWLLFSMTVALVGWGVLLANLKEAHQAVDQRALREANALARTHADRLARSLDSIDQVTRHVRLEWQLSGGRLRLEQLASAGLFPPPALYYVTLVDADGNAFSTTLRD